MGRSKIVRWGSLLFLGLVVLIAAYALRIHDAGAAATRPVRGDVRFDLGAHGQDTLRTYEIRPGDTLGHIAQRELGSARRVKDLVRWNPGVAERALQIGKPLRLPPREGASGAHAFYLWRDAGDGPGGAFEPVSPGSLHEDLTFGGRLLAVPMAEAGAAERVLSQAAALGTAPDLAGFAVSPALSLVRTVADTATARIVHVVAVGEVTADRIDVEVRPERLDDAGRPVASVAVDDDRVTTLVLTLLAVLVVAALVLVGARRLERGEGAEAVEL